MVDLKIGSKRTRASELDDALVLFHFAFRRLIEGADRVLAAHGLGRAHHRILHFIARRPGLCVNQLLDDLHVTKQALHGPLGRLVQGGWVRAKRSQEDARVKELHLTTRGAELASRLMSLQRATVARAFEEAGPRAESAWRAVMARLVGDLPEGPLGGF